MPATSYDYPPTRSGAALGPVAVIMAAGLGTRMRSQLPKVLHPVCGRPMLAYVIDAAPRGDRPPARHRLLAGNGAQSARCSRKADFALQDEPRGTGDAVRAALALVPASVEDSSC